MPASDAPTDPVAPGVFKVGTVDSQRGDTTASGPEFLAEPFDAESDQRPGREQVTFSVPDLAGGTTAGIERQPADDRKRILVADRPFIRECANRRGRVMVGYVPPDDPAVLPDRNHMAGQPLVRTVHQGLSVVQDGQPLQRRAEQQDLPVYLDQLGQRRARPETVIPRLIPGQPACRGADGRHPAEMAAADLRAGPGTDALRDTAHLTVGLG